MTFASFLKPFAKDRRGNAVVEFALIAPVLMAMMIGLYDLGRVIDTNSRLNHGVTAGLRYALSDAYAESAIEAAALRGSGFTSEEATASYTMFCECPDGSSVSCSNQCSQGYKRIFVQVDIVSSVETLFVYPDSEGTYTVRQSGFLQIP